MDDLEPYFHVSRNDEFREIHWASGGLWDDEFMMNAQRKLLDMSKPFRDDRKGFRVLGDMRDAKTQSTDMAENIRDSQNASAALGVTHMAIVFSSVLAKMQFRRVTAGLECEYFEDKAEALNWLRSAGK